MITGGTTGIGFATARCLAAKGSRVVIAGRDGTRGERAIDALRAEGADAVFIRTDVAHDDQVAALAAVALGGRGISVFGICAFIVDTPMVDRLTGGAGPEARAQFAAQFAPSGRLTTPEDVGLVVADLVSGTGSYPPGTVRSIDAGPSVELMQP